ncbi:MAG: hypothetical protein PHV33_00985 [Elusimicrobiales bacterium]|nr:hypothetical protein [Elusimicrobiales bacterium]
MPARFNLYSAWIDPQFYGWAAVFAAALLLLIYSLRRYRELGRAAAFAGEEPLPEPEAEPNPFLEEPPARPAPEAEAGQEEKTLVLAPGEQLAFLAAAETAAAEPAAAEAPAAEPEPAMQPEAPAPAPEETPAPAAAAGPGHAAAETFVRGIYAGINDLDERMKTIEAALSKGHVNTDFAVKFLEDMVQDMENLDKSKIKARIEYLLSDLKK